MRYGTRPDGGSRSWLEQPVKVNSITDRRHLSCDFKLPILIVHVDNTTYIARSLYTTGHERDDMGSFEQPNQVPVFEDNILACPEFKVS